jgi:tRNA G37 N-methylase Trm5
MIQFLEEHGFPPQLLPLLPKKWEILGHIATLKTLHPQLHPYQVQVAQAICKSMPKVKVVLLDEEGIKGELR